MFYAMFQLYNQYLYFDDDDDDDDVLKNVVLNPRFNYKIFF